MTLSTADKVLQALRSFGVKEEGQGKYRCNSPLRPGSNSHAFTVTIDDGEHGAYHDFVSGDSGSLYELAKALNIEIERAEVENTKRKYRDLMDYANAHGISAETLIKAGWKQVVKDNRPALQFKTATGDRWRFLDGEKPVYKSVSGYKKCWYGAQRAIASFDKDHPLVICNGEISTVTGQHYGLAAMCVTSGEGKLPDDLLRELPGKLWSAPGETTILIALDCDVKGRMTALQLQEQLITFGFTQTRAVDLLLGDKGDLADFCVLHGDKAAAALLTLPSLQTSADDDDRFNDEDFEIIDITEFKDLPPIEWVIEGEIPKRGFVTIFGESNVGKSFVALDYALRIARNEMVLYVALEGESGIPLRVFGWCKHHNVHHENLKFKMLVGYVSFFDGEDMKRFLTAITPIKPFLIVVDTFGLVMGSGDENSAGHVNMVMKATRRIQSKLGCTIIFIHHTNKGGVQERGSGALRGRMDTMIQVLPDDDLIRVESSKTRDTKAFPPKSIKLLPVQVEEGETLVPIPADQYVRDEDSITPDQHKVLSVLAMSANREGLPQRELAELSRITYGRTVRALSNLVDKELIDPPKKRGQHHRINNDGRKAIGLTPIDDDTDDDDDDGSENGHGSPKKKARDPRISPHGSHGSHGSPDSADSANLTSITNAGDPSDPSDPSDPHGENMDHFDKDAIQ